MTAAEHNKKIEKLVQKFEPRSKLLRTWELKGGISAQVTAFEIERPDGQTTKMVVRQHGVVDLKHNPHIAADEFNLLQLLHSVGLPVPKPYYFDQSSEVFTTPCVVLEYIEGGPEAAPSHISDFTFQLATQLFRIHTVDCSTLNFLPHQEKVSTAILQKRPLKLDESLDEGHIRDVLEAAWPLPQRNVSVLLHGDYWPGNIVWRDKTLVAIIDWEDAKIGDPLADLANSRLEILWAFGIDAMQKFTRQYQAMTTIDFTNLPYWDLCAALRPASKIAEWAANDLIEKNMREAHRWFITQAFKKVSN